LPSSVERGDRSLRSPRAALRLCRQRALRIARHRAVRAHRKRRSDGVDRLAADPACTDAASGRRRRARAPAMTRGRLFVVPNLLGVIAPDSVLPARTIAVARGLEHYVVENAKPARAFLKSLAPAL